LAHDCDYLVEGRLLVDDGRDSRINQARDVLVGYDASADDGDIGRTQIAEGSGQDGDEREVGAGEDRYPDDVDILVDGDARHLLRGEMEAAVHHLHASIAQGPRHDAGTAVVSIEADLGDQDADRSAYPRWISALAHGASLLADLTAK
jgi:hypothetical protein